MMRSELRTVVIENTGRSDKTTLINNSLDFAIQKLSRIHPFDQMRKHAVLPIVANDIQAQLPDRLGSITEIRLLDPSIPTNAYSMMLYRRETFLKMFPNVAGSQITGRPLYCAQDNKVLLLDRKSNGSYNLNITYTLVWRFETDSDECPIVGSDETLIAAATANVYRSLQMYADADKWMTEFGGLVKLLVIASEREIGLNTVAREWTNERPRSSTNPPWLDPFEGHSTESGR